MGSFLPVTGSPQHARQFPKYHSEAKTSVQPWTLRSIFWLGESSLKVHKVKTGYIALNWIYMSSAWHMHLPDPQSHSSFMCSVMVVSSLLLFLASVLSNKMSFSFMWTFFWLVPFTFHLFLRCPSCWYSKTEVAISASFPHWFIFNVAKISQANLIKEYWDNWRDASFIEDLKFVYVQSPGHGKREWWKTFCKQLVFEHGY